MVAGPVLMDALFMGAVSRRHTGAAKCGQLLHSACAAQSVALQCRHIARHKIWIWPSLVWLYAILFHFFFAVEQPSLSAGFKLQPLAVSGSSVAALLHGLTCCYSRYPDGGDDLLPAAPARWLLVAGPGELAADNDYFPGFTSRRDYGGENRLGRSRVCQ